MNLSRLAVWGVLGLVLAGFAAPAVHAATPEFGRVAVLLSGRSAPPAQRRCVRSIAARGDAGAGPAGRASGNGRRRPPPWRERGAHGAGSRCHGHVPDHRGGYAPLARRRRSEPPAGRWPGLPQGFVSGHAHLAVSGKATAQGFAIRLTATTVSDETAVQWRRIRLTSGGQQYDVPLSVDAAPQGNGAPRVLPALRRPLEDVLVEWDWRMQDGIDTRRDPRSYGPPSNEHSIAAMR